MVRLVALAPRGGSSGQPEWNYLGGGSGFFVNRQGQFVTNCHVFAGFLEVGEGAVMVAMRRDGDHVQFSDIRLVAYDEPKDLAVGEAVDFKDTVPLPISRASARKGVDVFALGFPLQSDDLSDLFHGFTGLASSGQRLPIERTGTLMSVSVKKGNVEDVKFMSWPGKLEQGRLQIVQNNAPVEPGNSGGPLIDAVSGEVAGVVAAGYEGENAASVIRLAVDSTEITDFLQRNNIRTEAAVPSAPAGGKPKSGGGTPDASGERSGDSEEKEDAVGSEVWVVLLVLGILSGAGMAAFWKSKSSAPVATDRARPGTALAPPMGHSQPQKRSQFARVAGSSAARTARPPPLPVLPPPPVAPRASTLSQVVLTGKSRRGEHFHYEIPALVLRENPGGLTIGAGEQANIEIKEPSLRPLHAKFILLDPQRLGIVGLGTAPVFVDGAPLPAGGKPVALKTGSTVQIGEVTFAITMATSRA